MKRRKSKVVIIGGGFAGSQVAKSLDCNKLFDVVLIDTKNYFEFTPGVLRTIVEPEHFSKIQVSHKVYLKKSKFICGCVEDISKDEVSVRVGKGIKKINFDYLVIATGSRYNNPIKGQKDVMVSWRAKKLRDYYKKLYKSKSVAVVGGGLVGVELAAEIATRYNKDVVLLHSRDRLMHRNAKKSSKYADIFLRKRGVKIVLGERFKDYRNQKIILENGMTFDADLVFLAIGIKPNYEFMNKHFMNSLDDSGFLRVNEHLQLFGTDNIFVAGDVSNIKEEKLAQNAEKQADVVVENIKNLECDRMLSSYVSRKRPIVISLGKYFGILEWGNFVLTGFIPGVLKNIVEAREVMIKKKI